MKKHTKKVKPQASTAFFLKITQELALSLLQYALVCIDLHGNWVGGRIVETEVYTQNDPCAHSFNGKTKRNEAMFMQAGTIYVYHIYGIHLCANIVTEQIGTGSAVLLRALEPLWGIKTMMQRRNTAVQTLLCSGPGKLTQALNINMSHNTLPCISALEKTKNTQNSVLRLLYLGPIAKSKIMRSSRIGVHESIPKLHRFYLKNNVFVSRLKKK